ncbi:MAG: helix-turn-helix domain-containing protein [Patescibacteria group bacterium]|nr:helix-turn-helix domain-containing protein [Patescibacteria group bacterium]
MLLAKNLQDLGLTEKEARLYVALSEMGEATPQQLALKSGINRATAYVTLDGLLHRGLVNTLIKQKKAHFSIESPAQIINLLEKERKQIENKINLAQVLMPELDMLNKLTTERTNVKFFEGKSGVLFVQKEIARSKAKKIDEIFNLNICLDFFPTKPNDHRKTLYHRKIKTRSIIVYDSREPILKLPLLWQEERRYLPCDKFPFYSDIVFYRDKAAILSLKDNFVGVIIGNKAIVDGLKTLFELAWQGAEPYKIELSE